MKIRPRFDVLAAIVLAMLAALLHNLVLTLAISGLVTLVTLNRWDRHARQRQTGTPTAPKRLLVLVEFWLVGAVCAKFIELVYTLAVTDGVTRSVLVLGGALAVSGAVSVSWTFGMLMSRQVNTWWSSAAAVHP